MDGRLSAFAAVVLVFVFSVSAGTAADEEPCGHEVGRLVSLQGTGEVKRAGETHWVPVARGAVFCPGDSMRILRLSRAAVVLGEETVIRLDQHSTVTFSDIDREETTLIDLIRGVLHFISRTPRSLKVITPFVNAGIEGTEFLVAVGDRQATIMVFEGTVNAENPAGSVSLEAGQAADAVAKHAPRMGIMVKQADAVQWALYYPPVVDVQEKDFEGDAEHGWRSGVISSIRAYREGDLAGAFSHIEQIPPDLPDARVHLFRAALFLSVGRVEEAIEAIGRVRSLSPGHGGADALESVIATARGEKDRALSLARNAVDGDPESSVARVALSYALQAQYDLDGARASLEEAVRLSPENGLAWARLAELLLSLGDFNGAQEAARKAAALNPRLARTHTVLGFAMVLRSKTDEAAGAFEEAIGLDQSDPLPRLGLGLVHIRKGRIAEGRRQLEIAASLDPGSSLVRSYLGKAYYEERRDRLAAEQYAMARDLDPRDPTPFFYEAILAQAANRPVEALGLLQESIARNDDRAVYRSRLMLDDDLASRSASLARIYGDLGFQQRALLEGWKSVSTDPANYSAHRFLADSYAARPRHEIARVSELLQSQMLQPLNITPVQPQLAESDLLMFSGTGPGAPSFHEFNPLFNRNRLALQVSGVAGGNDTLGDEIVVSGVYDGFSISAGQFHHETDGFRENNDLTQDIYNVFAQASISPRTSVQAEFRYKESETGDRSLNFLSDNFTPGLRQKMWSRSWRLGIRHAFTPASQFLASFIYGSDDSDTVIRPVIEIEHEEDAYLGEVQHLFRARRFSVISGIGRFRADRELISTTTVVIPPAPPITVVDRQESDIRHTNLYLYSLITYPEIVTWTLGGSADYFKSGEAKQDIEQFNPKIGALYSPVPSTTLRAAAFRVLKRQLIANQTLEPTNVAGFNQFYDDANGTEAWNFGVGVDQEVSSVLFAGAEYVRRELVVPYLEATVVPPSIVLESKEADWREDVVRAYLYWTPLTWMSARVEYQYEQFDRKDFEGPEQLWDLETHRIPVSLSWQPSQFTLMVRTTYVDQRGEFVDQFLQTTVDGEDRFWVTDASLSYRLPKRRGIISVEGRNLFDEGFRFQDTDPANPAIVPERQVIGKFTLAF